LSEAAVTSKVEELMNALDEVKRYRALSSLLVDFGIFILVTIVALLSVEVLVNLLRAATGFPCSFTGTQEFSCGGSLGPPALPIVAALLGLSFILIPSAGILGGVLWVDRKYRRVVVGQWKGTLGEGFPGAVKLLTGMKWEEVFEEIQVSKLAYVVYGLIKLAGYFVFVSFLMLIPYTLLVSFVHTDVNPFIVLLVCFVLVLVLCRRDLKKRYRQVWSLDSLMWELRWFSSEFGSASFKT